MGTVQLVAFLCLIQVFLDNLCEENPTKCNGENVTGRVKLEHGFVFSVADRKFKFTAAPALKVCICICL